MAILLFQSCLHFVHGGCYIFFLKHACGCLSLVGLDQITFVIIRKMNVGFHVQIVFQYITVTIVCLLLQSFLCLGEVSDYLCVKPFPSILVISLYHFNV